MICATTVTDKTGKSTKVCIPKLQIQSYTKAAHTVICSSAKQKAADRVDIKPWSSSTSLNEYETLSKEERWVDKMKSIDPFFTDRCSANPK